MNCLLCLRNVGIHFGFETNDLEILIRLLKLPKEFMQTLESVQCCGSCQFKLQIVGLVIKGIEDLKEKLKVHEAEVKEIFLNSFNAELNETDQLTLRARKRLFDELFFTVGIEEVLVDEESLENHFQNSHNKIEILLRAALDEQNDYSESPMAVPFAEINSNLNQKGQKADLDEPEKLANSESLNGSLKPKVKRRNKLRRPKIEIKKKSEHRQSFSSTNSVDLNIKSGQADSSQIDDSVQRKRRSSELKPSILPTKSEKSRKGLKGKSNLSRKSAKPTMKLNNSISKLNPTKKGDKYICKLCKTKDKFLRFAEYEEHFKSAHPSRPFSKCPKCERMVAEDKHGTDRRLKCHLKDVHTAISSFKCKNCKASFKTKRHLKQHSEVHEKNRQVFICPHCKAQRTGTLEFQLHLKTHLH